MGGEGSGRKPSEATIVARMTEQRTPIANDVWLPNYSGVQAAALKTATPLGTGTGGGHVIQEEGVNLNQRTNLNFSGSAVTAWDDLAGDATIVSIETGSVSTGNLTASGSSVIIYGGTGAVVGTGTKIEVVSAGGETDPVFMSLSGSMYNKYLSQSFSGSLPYLPMTLSGSMYDKYLNQAFSGSYLLITASGSNPVFMPIALSGSMYNKYLGQQFSGSLPYLAITASGSIPTYLPIALSGSMYNKYLGQQFSGSLSTYALSGGATVSLGTHTADTTQHNLSGSITAVLSSSGSGFLILSGSYVDVVVPFNCSLARATVLPNVSGSINVNVQKATYANYPTLSAFKNYILTENTKYQTTDSGTINAGDVVRITCSGASTVCVQASVCLDITKT